MEMKAVDRVKDCLFTRIDLSILPALPRNVWTYITNRRTKSDNKHADELIMLFVSFTVCTCDLLLPVKLLIHDRPDLS